MAAGSWPGCSPSRLRSTRSSDWAVMRVPVNVPGPDVIAMTSRSAAFIPVAVIASSIIGTSRAACPLCIGSNSAMIDGDKLLNPRPAATEQASKHVSKARTFITSVSLNYSGHFVEAKARAAGS